MQKQKTKKLTASKVIIFATSFLVGVNMGFASYFYFSKDLSDWQKNQAVDMRNESGLTKAKIYADSFSVGGISFCLSTGILLLVQKFRNKKKCKTQ